MLTAVNAQEVIPRNIRVQDEFTKSLDDQDEQKNNISILIEGGDMKYKTVLDLETDFYKGVRLYKANKYDQAYAIFAELSQWGIKDAQAILGNMFLNGEYVDKSTERGLAWLGVAKEGGMQQAAAESFDYVYKQLNKVQQVYIDQKVLTYIEKFGSEAQNMDCDSHYVAGSNIPEKRCIKVPGTRSMLYPIE